jgi:voltage-gated potassium channel
VRLDKWRRATNWPLTVSSLIFLVAYSVDVLLEPTGVLATIAMFIINFTWLLYAIDYVVSLALATHRWQWIVHHVLDLLIILLPALRPLRLIRVVGVLGRLKRTSGAAVRGQVTIFVASATVILSYVAALAILDTEKYAPGSNIHDFGTAVWWTFTTMTTVGYGDFYPVTALGRFIAVGVMIAGIAFLGVVTATLASWIVQRVTAADEESDELTRGEVSALRDEIAALRAELRRGAD